jgi:hypothetical protein
VFATHIAHVEECNVCTQLDNEQRYHGTLVTRCSPYGPCNSSWKKSRLHTRATLPTTIAPVTATDKSCSERLMGRCVNSCNARTIRAARQQAEVTRELPQQALHAVIRLRACHNLRCQTVMTPRRRFVSGTTGQSLYWLAVVSGTNLHLQGAP